MRSEFNFLHVDQQEITKTQAQKIKPRIIVKNMIKKKKYFSKRLGNFRKI